MGLLARRIPLALLLDLVHPSGPHSAEIYAVERDQEPASGGRSEVRSEGTD